MHFITQTQLDIEWRGKSIDTFSKNFVNTPNYTHNYNQIKESITKKFKLYGV